MRIFRRKVTNGSIYLVLGTLLLMLGCAVRQTVPVVDPSADVSASSLGIIKKIPLRVAVVIPVEIAAYAFTGNPHTPNLAEGATEAGWNMEMTFPLGQMLKKGATQSFSHAFASLTLIEDGPYPQDVDAVVIPTISEFQYWYRIISGANPFYREWAPHARIAIKTSVLDRNGMLLFEKAVSSRQIEGEVFNANGLKNFLEPSGRAAAGSVADALRQTAKLLATSPEIHAYAYPEGKAGLLSAATVQKPSAPVTSDVDALPAVSAKPNKNACAVVIGVETYRQNLPKADYAEQDAQTVTEYLTQVMGYPRENVVTLVGDRALKSDFEKYLEKWLSNKAVKDSTVFLYYSGHGAPDPKTGDAFLVPYDGDPAFIEETGYSLKRLYAGLEKLPAKEIVVVLDSCFSGAGGRSVMARGARPLVMTRDTAVFHSDRLVVLSAATGNQISSTHLEKGHGLFTYFFLKGVQGQADADKDGHISIDELYGYVRPNVEHVARSIYNNEQTPQLTGTSDASGRQQKMFIR